MKLAATPNPASSVVDRPAMAKGARSGVAAANLRMWLCTVCSLGSVYGGRIDNIEGRLNRGHYRVDSVPILRSARHSAGPGMAGGVRRDVLLASGRSAVGLDATFRTFRNLEGIEARNAMRGMACEAR